MRELSQNEKEALAKQAIEGGVELALNVDNEEIAIAIVHLYNAIYKELKASGGEDWDGFGECTEALYVPETILQDGTRVPWYPNLPETIH